MLRLRVEKNENFRNRQNALFPNRPPAGPVNTVVVSGSTPGKLLRLPPNYEQWVGPELFQKVAHYMHIPDDKAQKAINSAAGGCPTTMHHKIQVWFASLYGRWAPVRVHVLEEYGQAPTNDEKVSAYKNLPEERDAYEIQDAVENKIRAQCGIPN